MNENNSVLPSRTSLHHLIPQLIGRMVDFKPGKFVEFNMILDAVIDYLEIDRANPPYKIRGSKNSLRRRVYVSAWNVAVERREGHFWLVRVDPVTGKELRVPESGGKGKVGTHTSSQRGVLWGMTWYGCKRALELNGITAQNLTGLWMGDHYDDRIRNTSVAAVAKRCPLSATMSLEEEHAQEYAVRLLERDGLHKQLTAHQGYGRNIRPSEIGIWSYRDAFSQMRKGGTDGHLRAMCGATTETERKKAKETGEDTIAVGYQTGVSPIVLDTSSDDNPMIADFADQDSLSPEETEEAKDQFMHYEIMIERKLRNKKPEQYIKAMYMLYEDHTQREIADTLGVSNTTVSNMIQTLRELFAADVSRTH